MSLRFKDYGKVGFAEYQRTYRHPGEGWVAMSEQQPDATAEAQADGTWLVLPEPDLTVGEAENIVAMFPISYPYVFNVLGFGDVV